jgi:hypothetical protein
MSAEMADIAVGRLEQREAGEETVVELRGGEYDRSKCHDLQRALGMGLCVWLE